MHSRDEFDRRISPANASVAAAHLPVVALVLLAGLALGCGPKSEPASGSASGEASGAKALVEKKCSTCHGLSAFASTRGDAAKWTTIVDTMVGKGLKVTDQEKTEIIGYLAANQGP